METNETPLVLTNGSKSRKRARNDQNNRRALAKAKRYVVEN